MFCSYVLLGKFVGNFFIRSINVQRSSAGHQQLTPDIGRVYGIRRVVQFGSAPWTDGDDVRRIDGDGKIEVFVCEGLVLLFDARVLLEVNEFHMRMWEVITSF